MAKLSPKAPAPLFGINDPNSNYLPTPLGQFAKQQAPTPSLDPEVLMKDSDQGITLMTLKQDSSYALWPAGDASACLYSYSYYHKYLAEVGIGEYTPRTNYSLNAITRAETGITLYRSLKADNLGNPLTDTTSWDPLPLLNLKNASTTQQGTVVMATGSTSNVVPDNTLIASTYLPLAKQGNLKGQIGKSSNFTLQESETGRNIALIGAITSVTLPNLGVPNSGATFIATNQTSQVISLLPGAGITSISIAGLQPYDYCTLVYDGGPSWKTVSYGNYINYQLAPINSATLTGTPSSTTPATADSSTRIATTAFVKNQSYATTASVNTSLALKANLNSPALTGVPLSTTPATADNSTKIATTAFVKNQGYAPINSPTFTGAPIAPTQATTDNSTKIATTAFVNRAVGDATAGVHFSAFNVIAQVVTTTLTVVNFTVVSLNSGAYDGAEGFVAPENGIYNFIYRLSSFTVGTDVHLRKNSTSNILVTNINQNTSYIVRLNAGDRITIEVKVGSGSATLVPGGDQCYFSGFLVSRV